MKRVAITGCTGAIGISLINLCINKGYEVYTVCRPGSDRNKRIPNDALVKIIKCELSELDSFNVDGLEKCDYFIHLGGAATIGESRDDVDLQLLNVKYCIEAARLAGKLGCECFVGAGSQAEYGPVDDKLNADVATNPIGGYGIAKLCACQMSRLECQKLGLRHCGARILSVYGPYDSEKTVITSTARKLYRGLVPELTEGTQLWDYIYSDDAARALLSIAEKGKDASVYCVGSGVARPLKEYLLKLKDEINPDLCLDFGKVPFGPNQVHYLCADISDLTNDTGFVPSVDFCDGIKKTVEGIRETN